MVFRHLLTKSRSLPGAVDHSNRRILTLKDTIDMKNSLLLTICLTLGLLSCTSGDKVSLGKGEYIYWINSETRPCVGVGEMTCLQIQKGETLEEGKWLHFYDGIEGFDYEPGYIYKLIVKETEIPPHQVPADGSSLKFTLTKILSKQKV